MRIMSLRFIGLRFSICSRVMKCPKPRALRSKKSLSICRRRDTSSTVMPSISAAKGASTTATAIVSPSGTTALTVFGSKPRRRNDNSRLPAGTPAKRNKPVLSERACARVEATTTSTPGIGAPVESRIVPEIAPTDCADTADASAGSSSTGTMSRTRARRAAVRECDLSIEPS
jgi:hypothetical protein